MENNRFIKISTFLLTLGMLVASPLFVFAYSDETTHPGLTSETVKFFNLQYSNFKLGDAEKELLMKGSKEEDHGTRAMQHFYDPVYNRGITIAGIEWKKSKDWAQDTLAQASYSLNFISNPTERIFYGTVREFFESDTDYSWDRAIYEYAWGDKERGLEALGHTIHLIQDSSVPDHTRNDPHPPALHYGSPFEQWTAQFGPENIDVVSQLQNKKPAIFSNLDEYFDSVANYSNNNFFSKDTIFDKKYDNPTILYEWEETLNNGKKYVFGYKNTNGEQFRVVRIKRDSETLRNRPVEYLIEDPDNLILSDYWNLLSQQAVLHGAGVIKLFFDEVEKEKETKVLYNKNKSLLQKSLEKVKAVTSTVFFGSENKEGTQANTSFNTQSANVVSALVNDGVTQSKEIKPIVEEKVQEEEVRPSEEVFSKVILPPLSTVESIKTEVKTQNDTSISAIATPPVIVASPKQGGGGGSAYGNSDTVIQNTTSISSVQAT